MAGTSTTAPIELASDALRVIVSPSGAELCSLQRASTPVEYLWQGDPAFWNRRAPWLYPIVGALRDGAYTYRGASYQLPQHGFARDRLFTVAQRSASHVSLTLEDDAATRSVYPFPFRLAVTYRLAGPSLGVELAVENPGNEDLLFSIGGHPAFRCPLLEGERMEDYGIELEHEETAGRWPVVAGLIGEPAEPFLHGRRDIALTTRMFERGALVFKGLRSRRLRLVRRDGAAGVELSYGQFPYLGIWSQPGAPFVCLEPWCGIADSLHATGRLEDKEGVERLGPGARFERDLTITPF